MTPIPIPSRRKKTTLINLSNESKIVLFLLAQMLIQFFLLSTQVCSITNWSHYTQSSKIKSFGYDLTYRNVTRSVYVNSEAKEGYHFPGDENITIDIPLLNHPNHETIYLGVVDDEAIIPEIKDWMYINYTQIYHVKDVYFNSENIILRNDGYHYSFSNCHPRYWNDIENYPDLPRTYGPVQSYKSVVCIGHQHSSDFGHWFLEVFPALFLIPKKILDNSVVAVPQVTDFIIQHLSLLGVSEGRILSGSNRTFFAENYYTIQKHFCGDLVGEHIALMAEKIRAMIGLSDKKPTRFVFLQRKGMSREITNMDKLLETAQWMWPQFDWEIVEKIPENFIEAAKMFNEMQLVYSVHSSSLANTLFMQKNTIVVELQMEKWLLSFIYLSRFGGRYHVIGRDKRISWRKIQKNYINIEYNINLLEKAMVEAKII